MLETKYDFNDFIQQMRMIKSMGSFSGLLERIPGMVKLSDEQLQKGEDEFQKVEVMIGSMTKVERADPELLAITPSRRRRIALGCGRTEAEVNRMVTDFIQMRSIIQ
jgi:signal recognition particle subunit SRP54